MLLLSFVTHVPAVQALSPTIVSHLFSPIMTLLVKKTTVYHGKCKHPENSHNHRVMNHRQEKIFYEITSKNENQ